MSVPAAPVSRTLFECLSDVPDHRDARGVRHSLNAILAATVLAVLSGARGPRAIAQWARQHAKGMGPLLGFTRRPPAHTTYHYFFLDMDVAAFESALSRWLFQEGMETVAIAIDGKTLRGSKDGETPGMHLLTAYCPAKAITLAHMPVGVKTNEAKAILTMLKVLPIEGKTLTMDAMFTQREICQTIVDKGGHYVTAVKHNQPTLLENIEAAFEGPALSPLGGARQAGA